MELFVYILFTFGVWKVLDTSALTVFPNKCSFDYCDHALQKRSCYWRPGWKLLFPAAQRECQKDNGTLAYVPNQDALNFLVKSYPDLIDHNKASWIGAFFVSENAILMNTAGEEQNVTDWRSYNKALAAQCVRIYASGIDKDVCNISHYPLCSASLDYKGCKVENTSNERIESNETSLITNFTTDCKTTLLGKEYRGILNVSQSGRTCQRWDSQNPHQHSRDTMLDGPAKDHENYCRNPDNEPYGPWCYTIDSNVRWEYCDVRMCGDCQTNTTKFCNFKLETNYCFWMEEDKNSFEDAQRSCQKSEGKLAHVPDVSTDVFVTNNITQLNASRTWIGAFFINEINNQSRILMNTGGVEQIYTNWDTTASQPDGGEQCIILINKKWHDAPCKGQAKRALCYKEADYSHCHAPATNMTSSKSNTTSSPSEPSTTITTTMVTSTSQNTSEGTTAVSCGSHVKTSLAYNTKCFDVAYGDVNQMLDDLLQNKTLNDSYTEKVITEAVSILRNVTDTDENIYPAELTKSVSFLNKVLDVILKTNISFPRKDFLRIIDNVLSLKNTESWITLNRKKNGSSLDASSVLQTVEKLGKVLKNRLLDENKTLEYDGESYAVKIQAYKSDKEIIYPKKSETFFNLPPQELSKQTKLVYVAALFKTMPYFFSYSDNKDEIQKNTEMDPVVNSAMLTLYLDSSPIMLNSGIELTFSYINQSLAVNKNVSCNFLDLTNSKKTWNTSGCSLVTSDETKAVCNCTHLTNFAILMRPYYKPSADSQALKDISIFGCVITIFFATLTVVIYIIARKELRKGDGEQNFLVFNLCISLIFGYSIFILGSESVHFKITCDIVTAALHFFLLSGFFIMLSIGIYYFIGVTLINVAMGLARKFRETSKIKWFLPLSWGLPMVISILTYVFYREKEYHLPNYCWLSIRSGAVYAFFVPIIIIVFCNLCIIISLLHAMMSTQLLVNSTLKVKIRTGLRSLCTLLPVLGITWLFGFLAFNEATEIFQYLFVIANSLQGLLIFIFHGVLNQRVRNGLMKNCVCIHKLLNRRTSTSNGLKSTNTSPKTHTSSI